MKRKPDLNDLKLIGVLTQAREMFRQSKASRSKQKLDQIANEIEACGQLLKTPTDPSMFGPMDAWHSWLREKQKTLESTRREYLEKVQQDSAEAARASAEAEIFKKMLVKAQKMERKVRDKGEF